jgi:sensor domain CHASE-containing protein
MMAVVWVTSRSILGDRFAAAERAETLEAVARAEAIINTGGERLETMAADYVARADVAAALEQAEADGLPVGDLARDLMDVGGGPEAA